MKILTNPVLLRGAVVLTCSTFAFLLTLLLMRRLRKSINDEAEISADPTPSLETLPLHLYNTVIQQLKQQKHELDVQSRAEQQRARVSETFSHAVLSNLSCGVLVFGTNGLVKTSNPAAKEILGFASPSGMSAADIFRDATIERDNVPGEKPAIAFPHQTNSDQMNKGETSRDETNQDENARAEEDTDEMLNDEMLDEMLDDDILDDEIVAEPIALAAEVDSVLREGSHRRRVQAEYSTPDGESRFLSVTISPVPATDGGLLGVACLINDLSALENIRREQQLQGEMSAEMALQLRASLTTISGYAQQLEKSRDPELAKQLATDIAHEAAQLDRNLGSFLTEKSARRVKAAGASAMSS